MDTWIIRDDATLFLIQSVTNQLKILQYKYTIIIRIHPVENVNKIYHNCVLFVHIQNKNFNSTIEIYKIPTLSTPHFANKPEHIEYKFHAW